VVCQSVGSIGHAKTAKTNAWNAIRGVESWGVCISFGCTFANTLDQSSRRLQSSLMGMSYQPVSL